MSSNRSSNELFQKWNNERRNENDPFVDIKLKVGDRKFAAHRIVLRESSLFKEILSADPHKSEYILDEKFVHPDIMDNLLSYCYTCGIHTSYDNLFSMIRAAKHLNCEDLISEIEEVFIGEISSERVYELLFIAVEQNFEYLQEQCLEFFESNLKNILKDKETIALNARQFSETIENNNRSKNKYGKIIESLIVKFVEWSMSQKRRGTNTMIVSLIDFLKELNLAQLSEKTIENIYKTQTVRESEACFDIIHEAASRKRKRCIEELKLNKRAEMPNAFSMTFLNQRSFRLNLFTGKWTELSLPLGTNSGTCAVSFDFNTDHVLFLYGGRTSSGAVSNEFKHCKKSFETQKIFFGSFPEIASEPSAPRTNAAMAIFENSIYLTGGFNDVEGTISSTFRFDLNSQKWSARDEVPSMKVPREKHDLIEVYGSLYAIGGWNGGTDQKTLIEKKNWIEKLDPGAEKWELVDVSNSSLSSGQIRGVAHCGKIFLYNETCLDEYCPKRKTWKKHSANVFLQTRIVSIYGKLWALGGKKLSQSLVLYVFELADKEQTGRWVKKLDVAPFPIPDCDLSSFVFLRALLR